MSEFASVWGYGVDPVTSIGKEALEQASAEKESEGFPELEEFLQKFGGTEAHPEKKVEIVAVHYDAFNVMIPESKRKLEALQTRLASGKDAIICNEDTFFTKEGYYMVVLKWAEYKVTGGVSLEEKEE